MRTPARKFGSFLLAASSICCQISNSEKEALELSPQSVFSDSEYTQLLGKFPPDAQAIGPDPYMSAEAEHMEIYALILSAESRRWAAMHSADARVRLRACLQRLLEARDLDGDGKPGWGLPFAWDAFGDGSTNPVDHPYTISTAQVLEGFVDALEMAPDTITLEERGVIESVIAEVLKRWSAEVWTATADRGWYWYSPASVDSYNVVNISAMMLSVILRCLEYDWTQLLINKIDLSKKASMIAATIVSEMELRSGLPFWRYVPTPNALRQDEPNDMVHHIYILWGMERYRDSGIPPDSIPYSRAQAIESIRLFFDDEKSFDYPQDVIYSGDQASYQVRPMNLWAMGAVVAFLGEFQDRDLEINTLIRQLLLGDYGPWPDLRRWPRSFSTDPVFYPRYADHVLWGLACQLYSLKIQSCEQDL